MNFIERSVVYYWDYYYTYNKKPTGPFFIYRSEIKDKFFTHLMGMPVEVIEDVEYPQGCEEPHSERSSDH